MSIVEEKLKQMVGYANSAVTETEKSVTYHITELAKYNDILQQKKQYAEEIKRVYEQEVKRNQSTSA